MNRRLLGYMLLAAWGSWISALLGLADLMGINKALLPDVLLCLVVLIAAALPRSAAFQAALVLALARIAFSVDSPFAILASFLGAAVFVRTLRAGVEVYGPFSRGLLCSLAVWIDGIWLGAVRAQRAVFAAGGVPDDPSTLGTLFRPALDALPRALISGVLALFCGGILLSLPGLRFLEKRRTF